MERRQRITGDKALEALVLVLAFLSLAVTASLVSGALPLPHIGPTPTPRGGPLLAPTGACPGPTTTPTPHGGGQPTDAWPGGTASATPTPHGPGGGPTPTWETPPGAAAEGVLELSYPLRMKADEAALVTAEIMVFPRRTLMGARSGYASSVLLVDPSSQRARNKVSAEVRLYPIMSAELIAAGFDIAQGTDARRMVTTTQPAAWTWNITPRRPGRHQIVVNVLGEVMVGDVKYAVLEKSISREIEVAQRPLVQRIGDNLVANAATLIVAVLGTAGPIGLIMAYLTLRSQRDLRDRVERVEARLHEPGSSEHPARQQQGGRGARAARHGQKS